MGARKRLSRVEMNAQLRGALDSLFRAGAPVCLDNGRSRHTWPVAFVHHLTPLFDWRVRRNRTNQPMFLSAPISVNLRLNGFAVGFGLAFAMACCLLPVACGLLRSAIHSICACLCKSAAKRFCCWFGLAFAAACCLWPSKNAH